MKSSDMIDLKCWKCGAEKSNPRQSHDPPNAVRLECTCNDCEESGVFSEVTYFDSNRNEILPT